VYYDALVFRGKLHLKLKDLTKAYVDFKAASLLEMEKENQCGLLG
jgi:hypothetical protein